MLFGLHFSEAAKSDGSGVNLYAVCSQVYWSSYGCFDVFEKSILMKQTSWLCLIWLNYCERTFDAMFQAHEYLDMMI